MRTVKSLALDARQRHEWDVRVATAARLKLEEGCTANVVQTFVHPLERLMVSGVSARAIYLAISSNDQFYIGALVAFVMLTQRVASPLVQLSHLLQQYEEARFAVKAVSTLVNQPAKEGRSRAGIRTPLKGRIEFENVRFRYRGSTVPALDGVSFAAPEGTILGIMARSGSGKTTVTRLLQMLHSNYEGLIKSTTTICEKSMSTICGRAWASGGAQHDRDRQMVSRRRRKRAMRRHSFMRKGILPSPKPTRRRIVTVSPPRPVTSKRSASSRGII